MIKLSGLHKYFNKGKENELHVLDDISLTLPETGIVAIFGRSGCGKTTLLNVIGALDSYHSGSITEDGRAITKELDAYRNRDIGYIFQNYNLLKGISCFENVASALKLCGMRDPAEIDARTKTALSFVGMEHYANRTPDTLSGGQQQRVAIARAIVKNPRIILADEPTGNLDEENTVMVMELLREIAKDCLVLLVTHEADLVDYYCDTVIELHDGKVVNTRHNAVTEGYAKRDKNAVYLGELDKTVVVGKGAEVSVYGEPATPIQLKVVNYGGKIYLAIDSPGVQILDKDSEMKLVEGSFEKRAEEKKHASRVDMSRLPRVSGSHFGRLFTAKSAIASGYRSNFAKQKKGKRLLQFCLALFAAVVVLMTAIFGTSIGAIGEIKRSYNPNAFYMLVDGETAGLLSTDPSESGFSSYYLRRGYLTGDEYLNFSTGFFETFDNMDYNLNFQTHGVYLPSSLIADKTLLCGRLPSAENEVVLTSAAADILLEDAAFGYLKSYQDLIGLLSTHDAITDARVRVVGIVEAEDNAFFVDDDSLTKAMLNMRSLNIVSASEAGITVEKGKTVFYSRDFEMLPNGYAIGDDILVLGERFTLSGNVSVGSYEVYLKSLGIEKASIEEWMSRRMLEKYPSLSSNDESYQAVYDALYDTEYVLWEIDYFSELEGYARQQFFFEPDYENFLYLKKGIAALYYSRMSYTLYMATLFREQYGRLPTLNEINAYKPNEKDYYSSFDYEEYKKYEHSWRNSTLFVLADEDYKSLLTAYGESDALIDPYKESEKDDSWYNATVAVIYASDAERAEAFFQSKGLSTEGDFRQLTSPASAYEMAFADQRLMIVSGIATMGVLLAVMSICMYFIMRSALMNRIREIGIWRAVGVSRKNLVFLFAIETAVLTALTVLVGYLLASGFIFLSLSASSLVKTVFFYPVPLALGVLFVLLLISTVCGLLPIFNLTKKTPSAILSKYDI